MKYLGFLFSIGGYVLVGINSNWLVLVGLCFVMWGNNIGLLKLKK